MNWLQSCKLIPLPERLLVASASLHQIGSNPGHQAHGDKDIAESLNVEFERFASSE